ncbi:unnamed protein product [Peniophora sp. CBMAI 1063]|nr:unnamed protein product [Peniophora sp. CBMAI 1063]
MATESLLDAPPDFYQVLQGLPIRASSPGPHDAEDDHSPRSVHQRTYMAAAFICACVDDDSSNWSNFYSSTTAEQSSKDSSDDSPAPHIHMQDDDLGDELLQGAVRAALHGLHDLCSRPSDQLSTGTDDWRCPVKGCSEVVRPFDLTRQQCDVVAMLSGDLNSMLAQDVDNRVALHHQDPYKFLRYVDAIAWEHLSWHLHRAHITFYYPHPHRNSPVGGGTRLFWLATGPSSKK